MDEHRSAPGRNIGITSRLSDTTRDAIYTRPVLCAPPKHCCVSNIATYAALIHELHLNLRNITTSCAKAHPFRGGMIAAATFSGTL